MLLISSLHKRIISTLLLAFFLTLESSFAAIPSFINYQGFITNASGVAQSGSATVTVRIYDAPTGGTLLFEEVAGTVTITNGYFSIPIGGVGDVNVTTSAVNLTDLSFDRNYYVTVELGSPFSTGEMTLAGGIRSQIGVVPFAVTSYGALTSSTSTGLTTAKGKMYFDTVDNQLYVYNGTSWNALGIAGAGITTLNGLTGVSQFFAVGQAGSDITITSTGTTHTLNIPNAGSASRGVVSTTSQTFAGDKTFSGSTTLATTTASSLFATVFNAITTTLTNLVTTNATITNATSTNFFSSILNAVTGTISSLTGGNIIGGTLTATSSLIANGTLSVTGQTTLSTASTTALTATNLYSENSVMGNATATSLSVSNLSANNSIITENLSVAGASTLATTTISRALSVGTSTSDAVLYIQNSPGSSPLKVVSEVGSSLFSLSNVGVVAANQFKVGSTTLGSAEVLSVTPSANASYKVLASGGYVYAPDYLGNKLTVIKVTDPTSPRVVAELTPGSPIDLVKSGNYIYIVNYGTSVLSVYDVSNPDMPIAVTSTSTGIEPQGITLSGDKLYITSLGDNLLSIYDISNAVDPLLIGTTTVSTDPYFSAISGNYAYVSGYTDNTLYVVDISDPSAPAAVSNITLSAGAFQVETSDKGYTYVAADSGDIFVIDTRNPLAPTLLTTMQGVTFGRIKLSGDYLYTSAVTSDALDIYDVSNPSNPKLFRTVSVPSLVYSLDVVDKYAYTSGPGGTAVISLEGVTSQTGLFDSLVARFSSFLDSFRVTGASTLSGSVIMGTSSSNPTLDSLVYIEATSSKRTLVVGSATTSLFSVDSLGKVKAKTASIGTGLYAESTVASGGNLPTKSFSVGRYTYVSNYTDYNFSVIDTFNKEVPVVIGSVTLPGAPISLYVSGDYAYTTNDYDYSLSIVDISSSTAPTVVSSLVIGGGPNDIQVAGGYAYVANYSSDVLIVDVSSSTDMQIATSTATGGDFSLSTYLSGANLFVGSRDGTVSIFDVTTPTDPLLLSTTSTGGSVGAGFAISGNISVDGAYAYVANHDANTVTVIDVSNPSAPVVGSIVPTGVNPFALTISAGYMYVVNYSDNTISVFSLSDPAVPSRVATLTSGAGPHSAQVVDGYLYVTNSSDNTLSLFNVADIAGPSATANNLEVSNVTVRNSLSLSGLTAGAVPFIGASGRVSQDTNFFWDNTSKSLGVGTVAPTATLSVRGKVGVSAFAVEDINATSLFSITETGTAIVGAPSSVPNSTFVVSTVTGKDALTVLNSSGGTILSLTEAGVLRPNILELGSNGNGSSSIVINGAGLIEAGTTVIGKDYFSILSTPSTGARPSDLVVVGDYIYTADRDGGGVSSINVSNKRQATTTSFVATGNYPTAIASSNDSLYVVNANDDTLSILDISSSSVPFVASTTGVGDYPVDLVARGDYVYVISSTDSYLTILDVGDPTSPQELSSTLLSLSPRSISINGNYAYIGTSVGTVLVVNITDPSAPSEITPIFPNGQGVGYVYAEDTYLYISNTNTDVMYIYDISDPNFPIILSSIETDAAANSGQVMVQGDFAYVIDISAGSVLIIDIRNKSLPVARGRASTAPYSEKFFVKDNYLFAANQNGDQLTIVDLGGVTSVYANITTADFGKLFAKNFSSFLGGLSVGSTTSRLATLFLQSEAGKNPFAITSSTGQTILSVTQQGSLLLATTTSTFDNSKFVVQGTTTLSAAAGSPTALRVIGNIDNTASFFQGIIASTTAVGADPWGVSVSGNYAYVANTSSDSVSVVDISNPVSPSIVATLSTGVGSAPASVYVSGKYAYTADAGQSTITIIDISKPSAPVVLSTAPTGAQPYWVHIAGKYAYTADRVGGTMSIIDISNPRAPVTLSSVAVGQFPISVFVSGNYAYTADSGTDQTMSVIDISDPNNPVVVASPVGGTDPYSVYVSGRYAYMTNYSSGDMSIFDISNPASPALVATPSVGSTPSSVFVTGRYAYVTNTSAGTVTLLDVSDPYNTSIIGSTSLGGAPTAIVVKGRYLYVTNQTSDALEIVDLGGIESTAAIIHSLETGNLSVRNDIIADGNIVANSGLTIGSRGFQSQGNSSVYGSLQVGTSTYPNFLVNASNNTTNIGTSTGLASLFVQGTSTLNPLTIASSTGTTLLALDQSGYLGINTSAPTSLLDIVGTSTSGVLSAELITDAADRNFSSANNWTYNTGWTRSAGTQNASTTADNASTLTLSNTFLSSSPDVGKAYQISFSVYSYATGTLTLSFGSSNSAINFGNVYGNMQTQTVVLQTSGTGDLTLTPDASWLGTIDNVSIREITGSDAVQKIRNANGGEGLELRAGGQGLENSFVGYQSGMFNINGGANAFFGYQAGFSNVAGSNNVFTGYLSGYSNTTGDNNIFSGSFAGYNNTTGSNNLFMGFDAGAANTTGSFNIFNGYQSGYSNTIGENNIFSGSYSGYSNMTGDNNIFTGNNAGYFNTDGYNNIFTGNNAGYSNIDGYSNIFTGPSAGYSNTTGVENIFIGPSSGYYNTTGSGNAALGSNALYSFTNGLSNVAIGINSGYNQTQGNNNIFIGASTDVASSTGSNQLSIGNLIYGVDMTGAGAGNIGIGTSTPAYKLDVAGTANFTSDTGITISGSDYQDAFNIKRDIVTGQLQFTGNQIAGLSGFRFITPSAPEALSLLDSGDIGIGTSTPGSRLDVASSTSTSDIDIFRIITDVGGVSNVKFRIDSDGDIFTDGDVTIDTPADVAENYPTLDETLVPGMVVSLSSTTLTWSQSLPDGSTTNYEMATVKKATKGEEALGVISTRPGILLGGNTQRGTPVAFSGRVPVKVTNENGVVMKGDALTVSSSTPGHAMKMTKNGYSIGRAISSALDISTSTVLMVVENKNRTYSLSDVEGLAYIASTTIFTKNKESIASSLASVLSSGGSFVVEYVSAKVSAVAGYFDKLFAKEIFTETICIKKSDGTDICLNGDQVENMLNATEAPLTTGSSGGSSSSTPNIPPSEQQGEVTGTSTEESIPDIDTSGDADVESPPSSLGDTEEGTEDVVPDLENPPEEQSVPDQNLPITLSEE